MRKPNNKQIVEALAIGGVVAGCVVATGGLTLPPVLASVATSVFGVQAAKLVANYSAEVVKAFAGISGNVVADKVINSFDESSFTQADLDKLAKFFQDNDFLINALNDSAIIAEVRQLITEERALFDIMASIADDRFEETMNWLWSISSQIEDLYDLTEEGFDETRSRFDRLDSKVVGVGEKFDRFFRPNKDLKEALAEIEPALENEILVLIARFQQRSESYLDTHFNWIELLEEVISQLKIDKEVRLEYLDFEIFSKKNIQKIKKDLNPFLIIWGSTEKSSGDGQLKTYFEVSATLFGNVVDKHTSEIMRRSYIDSNLNADFSTVDCVLSKDIVNHPAFKGDKDGVGQIMLDDVFDSEGNFKYSVLPFDKGSVVYQGSFDQVSRMSMPGSVFSDTTYANYAFYFMLAQFQLFTSDYSAASENFESAIDTLDKLIESHAQAEYVSFEDIFLRFGGLNLYYLAAVSFALSCKYSDAIALIEVLLNLKNCKEDDLITLKFMKAECEIKLNNSNVAIQDLNECIEIDKGQRPYLYLKLADLHQTLEEYVLVISNLRKYINLIGESQTHLMELSRAHMWIADSYYVLDKKLFAFHSYSEANKYCEEFFALSESIIFPTGVINTLLIDDERFAKKEPMVSFLTFDPYNYACFLQAYINALHLEGLCEAYNNSIRKIPDFPQLLVEWDEYLEEMFDLANKASFYGYKNLAGDLLLYAGAYSGIVGKIEWTEKFHMKRHQLFKHPCNFSNLGVAFVRNEMHLEAIEQFTRAIQFTNNNRGIETDEFLAAIYIQRGCSYHSLGNISQRDTDFNQAKKLNPMVSNYLEQLKKTRK